MKKKSVDRDRRIKELPKKADEQLANSNLQKDQNTIPDIDRLIHELRVHQIELEMQNEELRRTQIALEESRNHYVELYDFAPVGYLSLDMEGTIIEINLTACNLLGNERKIILNQRLERFISDEYKDSWNQNFVYAAHNMGSHSCELQTSQENGKKLTLRLDYLFINQDDKPPFLRVTLSDMTNYNETKERELKKIIDRYELVLEGAQDAIWDWDVSNKRVHYSSRWKALRGFAEDEVGNDENQWSAGIHPEDKARVFAAVQTHLDGSSPVFNEEYRIQCKDGTWKWILDRGIAKKDASGRVVRMAGSEKDITERKLAEQELRDRENQLRLIMNLAPALISYLDTDLRYVRANNAYENWYGVSLNNIIGRKASEIVNEKTWTMAQPLLERALQGETVGFEDIVYKNDIARYVNGTFVPDIDSSGKIKGIVVYVADITELKNAIEELQERENQLRLIMNMTPALISYVNPELRYVRVNKTYEDWFGIAKEEMLGKKIREVIGEKMWATAEPYLISALAGETVSYEDKLLYANNISRWVNAAFVPDKDPTGKVNGIVIHVVDMEERKQAEQKIAILNQNLEQRIEEMEAFLNTTPIGLCITTDLSAKSIRGNPSIEQMFGLPANSELSLGSLSPPPLRALVNGSEPPANELPMQRAVRGERVTNELLDIQRPDGKTITMLCNAAPLFNQQGAVRGAVGAFLDVTALRNAESALRDSEERFRLAQNAGNLGIFDQDLVSGEMHWDERLRELWGIQPGEPLITDTCMASVHPDDRAEVYAAVNRSFNPQGKGDYHAEYRIIRPTDGRVFWLAAFGTTIFDCGCPIRLVGFVQDISERKCAEELLRTTEIRLSLAMEALNAGFWEWEREGNKAYFSPVWKKQLGYEDHEMPNRQEEWESRLHPDDRDYVFKTVEHYLNNFMPSYLIEFRLLHKDGSYRWIQSRAGLTYDENNQLICMAGIHLDITDYKRSKELNQQRTEMEETFRLNVATQTVAAIAHELNQPLTAISYFADAAVDMVKSGNHNLQKLNRVLENCSQQAQRAGQVIRQLFSVLQKGEPQNEAVDINRMVNYAYLYIKNNNQLNKFTLELNLAAGLPPVLANTLQIQKILINVINNSLEAIHGSGNNPGAISIMTCLSPNDPWMAQITVKDTGVGVSDADALNKMFQPFYTTKSTGLGMGLAISRSLIEAHGGKMWAEENAKTGISVHFTLPFML